jgi:hypothetical protein
LAVDYWSEIAVLCGVALVNVAVAFSGVLVGGVIACQARCWAVSVLRLFNDICGFALFYYQRRSGWLTEALPEPT